MTRPARAAALVFAAALAFLAVGAASRGLWTADEHRYAEVSRVMTTPGGDLLVPHLNGEIYVHKPPFFNWIVALVHGPLGVDLALAAKVPGILGGALAVLAAFLIARRVHRTAAGIAAAVVLATGAEFDWIARRGNLDGLLVGFTATALWTFVRGAFPRPDEKPPGVAWAVLGGALAGCGILVKGPVAAAIPGAAVLAFVAVTGEWRRLLSGRALLVVFTALAIPAMWLAAAVVHLGPPAGMQYATDLVLGHGVGHAAGQVDKLEPFWFYARSFPVGFLPWTLLLPAAVLVATARRRDGERRADLFALAALAGPLVLLSLSPAKRDLYLMAVYPSAALVVSKLAAVDEERRRTLWLRIPAGALAAVFLVTAGAAIAFCCIALFPVRDALDEMENAILGASVPAFPELGVPRLVVGLALGAAMAAGAWRALRGGPRPPSLAGLGLAAVAGSLFFAAIWLPAADPLASPRAFYGRTAAPIGDAPFARLGVDDFAANWTLRRDVVPFLETPRAAARFLTASPGPAFVVVERSFLERTGMPVGATVVLEEMLPLGHDLVLLARAP